MPSCSAALQARTRGSSERVRSPLAGFKTATPTAEEALSSRTRPTSGLLTAASSDAAPCVRKCSCNGEEVLEGGVEFCCCVGKSRRAPCSADSAGRCEGRDESVHLRDVAETFPNQETARCCGASALRGSLRQTSRRSPNMVLSSTVRRGGEGVALVHLHTTSEPCRLWT